MSNSSDATLVMFGLSGSGKTNFLVALDVILDRQTESDGLVHSDLASDRAYLQPLKEQWLRGEELKHTSRRQPPPPHLLLIRHPPTGVKASFHLPDIAGETFDAHFVTRSFPPDFCNRVKDAGGFLFFLHCGQNAEHDILENQIFIEPSPNVAPGTEKDWKLEDAAAQVKLVDLLQFIAEVGPLKRPVNIAVIMSAWDLVECVPTPGPRSTTEIPKDPERFFSKQWPLLAQYFNAHTEAFNVRVFGVSARGGGTTEKEIARLTGLDRPSERIQIVDGAHRSNDLTRPVRWLLGLLNA